MPRKYSAPLTIRAAALTLSGSIATVVGTVATDAADRTSGAIPLGYATKVMLRIPLAELGREIVLYV